MVNTKKHTIITSISIKYKMKFFYKIQTYLLLGTVFLFTHCKKNELDFDKLKSQINPEILMPLGSTSITAGKILKQDDIIKYDPDGLIHLKFKQDSVLHMTADSILNYIKLGKSSASLSMGEITLNGISQSAQSTLMDFFGATDTAQKNALKLKQGTSDIFPSVNTTSTKSTTIVPSTEFENLKISKGRLVFDLKNNLPTNISEIQINLIDNLPTPHTLGTVKFNNVAAGNTAKDSINLSGITLSNNLSYVIPVTKIDQSTSNVTIDTNSNIGFTVTGSRLSCIGGKAKIPAQTLNVQSFNVDLSDPSSDAKLRNVLFGTAAIPVSIESKFCTDLSLNIAFPDATQSGNPISNIVINALSNSTTNTNIDFSNTNLFLGASTPKNYNTLRTGVGVSIKASTGMVVFDSSDNIKITFDPSGSRFAYLDGYLGTKTYNVNIKDLDVSELAKLGKGIKMENPIMNVYVDNSFGIPVLVKLDITSIDDQNNSLSMDVDSMPLPYPTIAEKGQTKSQNFSINKSNSNIVNCLGMPAKKFNIVGTAIINPDGFKGFTDHIVNTSTINVGFDADIPMTFTAKNFVYTDTLDNGVSLRGYEDYEFLELKVKTTNGFPLTGTLDLIFTDSIYNKIDSVMSITLLQSGIPDANGHVITATSNLTTFLLENSLLNKLNTSKCKYILVRTNFNTYNSGNVPVSIYTDCKLDVSLAFRAKGKFKL